MSDRPSDLNSRRRTQEIGEVVEEIFDLLVVGGGVTGVGVALDAASRGLKVVLIESEDLAYGTSRFSSKLVHGGLRYLATGDVGVARESALERHLLMTKIAPHLTRSLPQILPLNDGVTSRQWAAGATGMLAGDFLRMGARTPRSLLPPPRIVSAHTAKEMTPALNSKRLKAALLFYDGQLLDDARLVVTIARTAAAYGAKILTRMRALRLGGEGASVEDTLSGERFEIRARGVINATGVWAGTLDESIKVRPSRGTHIVLDAADLGYPKAALHVPHVGSISRYIFALPQENNRVILGLTDEDSPGAVPKVAHPTEKEISFLLETFNRVLEHPITRDQVRGSFAGLRPLIDSGHAEKTSDVSRQHLVTLAPDGFVTILGGKLTTYRRMAQDAVDFTLRTRGIAAPESNTRNIRLIDIDDAQERSLRKDALEPVLEGLDIKRADIEYAVRSEGALTVDDVLDRRTRIGFFDADRARSFDLVSEIVSETLQER